MIKGKLEAKLTLNIEMTDAMVKAIDSTTEEVLDMMQSGLFMKLLGEAFSGEPLLTLLGGYTIEQISAEVHEV